jgi:nitroreductase
MNENLTYFYDIIKTRRSVRKFDPKPLPDEMVKRIVNSGLWAPSGMNTQPWYIHVLKGQRRDEFAIVCRAIWDRLKQAVLERYGEEGVKVREPFYMNLGDAPVAVAIYADKESSDSWAMTSCAAAAENMLLAATAEGIGSLYMGAQLTIKDKVDAFFGEDKKLICCVLLGYSADTPKPLERRADRVNWGEIE